jgi:hypothetical protein
MPMFAQTFSRELNCHLNIEHLLEDNQERKKSGRKKWLEKDGNVRLLTVDKSAAGSGI